MNYLVVAAFCFAKISLCSSDRFESEFLWPQIEPLKKAGELDRLIQERIYEIKTLNELWSPFIVNDSKILSKCLSLLEDGKLLLQQEGAGAAYILYDPQSTPQLVIKPNDENIFCLNNPKHFASPFLETRVKATIPLYRAAQTDAACYELAKVCGLERITPKTVLALISHPHFSYVYREQDSPVIAEKKLCSIQEYLQGTLPLRKVLESFFISGLPEEELLERLDQEDFEEISLFLWLILDSDAHIDNFRVYPKRITPKGDIVYGILKIDNSLALPESNSEFSSPLMHLPHALLPLSSRIREKILSLSLEEIQDILEKFRLHSSISSFKERIQTLQNLSRQTGLTYHECSLRISS